MHVLPDDPVIEVVDTSDNRPKGIELIDIDNEEYSFCGGHGQRA